MAHGFLVLGQTLLALLLLGLAGGWVLWPFRQGKPYLLLAAPLSGLVTVGLGLVLLTYVGGMPVRSSGQLVAFLLTSFTLFCLFEWYRRGTGGGTAWCLIGLTFLGISVWATIGCNSGSIHEGEPTISCAEGSDAWGYSIAANWLLRHPGVDPPMDSAHYTDLFVHVLFKDAGDRPSTFCLVALGAVVRGTSPVFSYDWCCGVVLGASVLGLAGGFATSRKGLVLLLLAGILSSWLTMSRTGYFGKLLGYPSCLLAYVVFLEAWSRPSISRWLLACLLGIGSGLCLNPVTTFAVLGLGLGGMTAPLLLACFLGRSLSGMPSRARPVLRHLASGLALYLLVTGPLLVVHAACYNLVVPGYTTMPWSRLIPIALDLDNPGLVLMGETTSLWLVLLALAIIGTLLVFGWAQGNPRAMGFLLCVALIPVAWCLDNKSLYAFHGILFPLTAIGAVLVVQDRWHEERSRKMKWATLTLAVTLVAMRLPLYHANHSRYVAQGENWPARHRQSDVSRLLEVIGTRSVDVLSGDVHTASLIHLELSGRGVPVCFPEPAWTRLFGWTRSRGIFPPVASRKGDFTLRDAEAWAPEGSVRFRNHRLSLSEDGDRLTIRSIQSPLFVAWDERTRPCFMQGVRPSVLQLSNGTSKLIRAVFVAEARVGPSNGTRHQLCCRFGDKEACHELKASSSEKIRFDLEVPPGLHSLTLQVIAFPGSIRDENLVLLTDLQLETRLDDRPGDRTPQHPCTPHHASATTGAER